MNAANDGQSAKILLENAGQMRLILRDWIIKALSVVRNAQIFSISECQETL